MILITGATGTNGIEVAKLLSGTGQTFRAMVRSRESAGALTDLPGAELVEADFDDRNSLISAATGQPVSYVDVPENQFREMLAGLGMGAWQADGLVGLCPLQSRRSEQRSAGRERRHWAGAAVLRHPCARVRISLSRQFSQA